MADIRRLLLLAIAVCFCGAACSSGGTSEEAAIGTSVAEGRDVVSSQQVDALEDGVVSADEYEAAYRAFGECMEEAGFPLIDGGMDNGSHSYSYVSGDQKATEHCYDYYFFKVDARWQIQHVDTNSTTRQLQECLTALGVEPAKTREEVNAQLEASGVTVQQCMEGAIPTSESG